MKPFQKNIHHGLLTCQDFLNPTDCQKRLAHMTTSYSQFPVLISLLLYTPAGYLYISFLLFIVFTFDVLAFLISSFIFFSVSPAPFAPCYCLGVSNWISRMPDVPSYAGCSLPSTNCAIFIQSISSTPPCSITSSADSLIYFCCFGNDGEHELQVLQLPHLFYKV